MDAHLRLRPVAGIAVLEPNRDGAASVLGIGRRREQLIAGGGTGGQPPLPPRRLLALDGTRCERDTRRARKLHSAAVRRSCKRTGWGGGLFYVAFLGAAAARKVNWTIRTAKR